MPELNPTPYREPYSYTPPLDERVSSSYDYIVVPAVKIDNKYKIPTHVGEERAKSGETVADTLVIYYLKTGEKKDIPISESIRKSRAPGIELYNYIKNNYPKSVLITSKKLKISEIESDLEKIINETAAEGEDVDEVIGKYIGRKPSEEKEYKSKETEEKAKYEGKEVSEEDVEAKKEVRGKEGEVVEGEETAESESEVAEEGGDVEGSSE